MAKAKSSKPRPYSVRVSPRAKHVSIRISHLGDVEVVIPQGFDQRRIPAILEKRQDWIAKTTQRIAAERQMLTSGPVTLAANPQLPDLLHLRSIAEQWSVRYVATEPASLGSTSPGSTSLGSASLGYVTTDAAPIPIAPLTATISGPHQLTLRGTIDQPQLCYRLLKHWLARKAEAHLVPWLRQVSQDVALPCNKIAVRGQKTLWASCSAKKNISLNYKLLFLPSHLVRYVFIHELCHTIHLNHSIDFWSLVEEKEPNYRLLDSELNKSWPYIPEWVERVTDLD